MNYTGDMFEKAVRRSGISITVLSRKLRVNRRTLYNWFRRDSVSIDVIYRAAKVIGPDFFHHFPGLELSVQKESVIASAEGVDYWKMKYTELLEKYNELLLKIKQAS